MVERWMYWFQFAPSEALADIRGGPIFDMETGKQLSIATKNNLLLKYGWRIIREEQVEK